jgi:hypothetical protein
MPAYENKSFEELRCDDYASGNVGTDAPSLFGASIVELAARSLWSRCHVRLDNGMLSVDDRNEVRAEIPVGLFTPAPRLHGDSPSPALAPPLSLLCFADRLHP